jgi:D-3-phosphoglycerate dehydrogenase / 2-oxoglutarate reductase
MKKKLFIATSSFAKHSKVPLNIFSNKKFDLIFNPTCRKLTSEEIIKYCKDATGIIAGTELYDKETLSKLTNLKIISRLGVGMDNIDLLTTKNKDIKVFKTTTTPALAVAELVLGLIINLSRNISQSCSDLKDGKWNKQMGNLLNGKTLGIIGLGKIGKTLVEVSRGFQFNVLAFDKIKDNDFAKKHNLVYCDLDSLLAKSDIISIHLNLTDKLFKFINSKKINLMKSNAILINTSRGELIDERDLYNSLKSNSIGGAGLDVFNDEPYFGPLSRLNNTLLTPHIGSYAKEIRIKMEIEASKNLIDGLYAK